MSKTRGDPAAGRASDKSPDDRRPFLEELGAGLEKRLGERAKQYDHKKAVALTGYEGEL